MGFLSQFQSDPTGTLILLLYRMPAILIALTLHELAHGYVALKCGDPTAQMLGRLTFNPLRHLDPVGTVFMFLFGFGWARPVPVNPRNYKNFKRDDILVSLAGITVNFLLFFFTMWVMFGIDQVFLKSSYLPMDLIARPGDFLRFDGLNYASVAQAENGKYFYFTDLLKEYVNTPWLLYAQRFLMYFTQINLGLGLFNLLPIPPLDGYHVANDILLRGKLHIPANVVNILMTGLRVLLLFTHVISDWIVKAMCFVQGGVLDLILMICGTR